MHGLKTTFDSGYVAPVRERGLKFDGIDKALYGLYVAPVRERGLKCQFQIMVNQQSSRSRKGAWIEIPKL